MNEVSSNFVSVLREIASKWQTVWSSGKVYDAEPDPKDQVLSDCCFPISQQSPSPRPRENIWYSRRLRKVHEDEGI